MDTALSGSYDAILVLSFGGPEGVDDVIPFLENVTRGRGIPKERLAEVGEHYYHFGGVSPLNNLNREIIAHLEEVLRARGIDLPVYFGNRNWHPLGEETAERMAADGVTRALVFATSAWGGYSGDLQYNEDIRRIIEHLKDRGLPEIEFTKIRQFYDHPAFINLNAAALTEARSKISTAPEHTKVLFTAHSIPEKADIAAGAPREEHLYSRQVAECARLVAKRAGITDYELVWQSRSGDPAVPWLDPDIVDRTVELNDTEGITAVVVDPIGFISDHIEVAWDLDTELKEATDQRGMELSRAATVGDTTGFAELVADLIQEQTDGLTPESIGEVTVSGASVNGAPSEPTFQR